MPHAFEVHKELTLDATPEQVWQAIATGPGIDSWYMGRNEIDPGAGGATRLTIGGHTEAADVTAWEPSKRLAYRGETGENGAFMAFEWLIEARDRGSTVLRLVHNGFLGDDWETEYDALNKGWDMYLHKLVQYLTYFPGRTATPVFAARPEAGAPDHAFASIRAALGLTAPVAEGDHVRLTPDGFAPIEGVVDYVSPTFLGVRTSDALYRFIYGMRSTFVVGHHLFAGHPDPERADAAWQSWLDHTFA
ncbi:SRPBCC family protein [Streptosporangium sp. KLBMP 9127]|nr:SRPBCC domain-containing protein [Streptosporangium sp. KLBMP 9127]